MNEQLKKKISQASRMLTTMTNQDCRKVINTIQEEAKTVTDIWIETRLNLQCRVSYILSNLRKLGLVKSYREGKNIYYIADKENIDRINGAVVKFLYS